MRTESTTEEKKRRKSEWDRRKRQLDCREREQAINGERKVDKKGKRVQQWKRSNNRKETGRKEVVGERIKQGEKTTGFMQEHFVLHRIPLVPTKLVWNTSNCTNISKFKMQMASQSKWKEADFYNRSVIESIPQQSSTNYFQKQVFWNSSQSPLTTFKIHGWTLNMLCIN